MAFIPILSVLLLGADGAWAGEKIAGPVHVCRKPMLGGNAAMADLIKPGPDAWKAVAERLQEEAKYCYQAGNVELISKGGEIDVGLNTKCTEYLASANGDRVFIVVGTKDRVWGRCP